MRNITVIGSLVLWGVGCGAVESESREAPLEPVALDSGVSRVDSGEPVADDAGRANALPPSKCSPRCAPWDTCTSDWTDAVPAVEFWVCGSTVREGCAADAINVCGEPLVSVTCNTVFAPAPGSECARNGAANAYCCRQ
jgi:hypothetical protein